MLNPLDTAALETIGAVASIAAVGFAALALSGKPKWTDPDAAPELTDDFFDRAELRHGEDVIHEGRGTLTDGREPMILGEEMVIEVPEADLARFFVGTKEGRDGKWRVRDRANFRETPHRYATRSTAHRAARRMNSKAEIAHYRCTRCGRNEIDAKTNGCARGPCPMEPVG